MTIDLSTRYLGLNLKNPLIISSCPLTGSLEMLRRMADAGAAAAVLPSLFEEQIEHQYDADGPYIHSDSLTGASGETLQHYRELKDYNAGPEGYLGHIEAAKKAVAIPIIASLNGTTDGGWVRYAQLIEQAGADALELNMYFVATDPSLTGEEVERRYLKLVSAIRAAVRLPLAVKVGPYFSSFANMAQRLVAAGADGMTLFNRFVQPDIDLDHQRIVPRLVLSNPDELRLPLRWIAILRGQLQASLAISSGIHFPDDVIKALFAGADATMLASTLYRRGINQISLLLGALQWWLELNNFESIAEIKGRMSQQRYAEPAAFERAHYVKAVTTFPGKSA